ncbi:MAG: hypothetical protein GF341_08890 [candidate division Zixibacteria bacterium]|nr:hypothetical protein [candidate division Zixibacteria bacterium]
MQSTKRSVACDLGIEEIIVFSAHNPRDFKAYSPHCILLVALFSVALNAGGCPQSSTSPGLRDLPDFDQSPSGNSTDASSSGQPSPDETTPESGPSGGSDPPTNNTPEEPPTPGEELRRPDDYANNITDAWAMTEGTVYLGTIDYAGDVDFFSFQAQAGDAYLIETTGRTDTYLRLYASNGDSELARNDDGGTGTNARIQWHTSMSHRIYISVTHYASGTGDYRVVLSRSSRATLIAENVESWSAARAMDTPDIAYSTSLDGTWGEAIFYYDAATGSHSRVGTAHFDQNVDESDLQISSDGRYITYKQYAGDLSSEQMTVVDTDSLSVSKRVGASQGSMFNSYAQGDIGRRYIAFPARARLNIVPDSCNCEDVGPSSTFPSEHWYRTFFAFGNGCNWAQAAWAYQHGSDTFDSCNGPWNGGSGMGNEVWWTRADNQDIEHRVCSEPSWWRGGFPTLRTLRSDWQLLSNSPTTGYEYRHLSHSVTVSEDDNHIAYVGDNVYGHPGSRTAVIIWDVGDSCNTARNIREIDADASWGISFLKLFDTSDDLIAVWAETDPDVNQWGIFTGQYPTLVLSCPDDNRVGSIHARRMDDGRIRLLLRTWGLGSSAMYLVDLTQSSDDEWTRTDYVPLDDVIDFALSSWPYNSGTLVAGGRAAIINRESSLYQVELPESLD